MATKLIDNHSLDANQAKGFNQFYKSLPEKSQTTIRFFNRVDFYTLHGQDALFAAKEFYKTTSFVKIYGSGEDALESITFNKNNFEAFVRELLLIKHYRVEVYVNKGIGKSNNSNNWTLNYKGSPGNLSQFEELLFGNVDKVHGESIIAIKTSLDTKNKKSGVYVTGVALMDLLEQRIYLTEYTDNEYYSNTEAIIVHMAPKEAILSSENNVQNNTLKKIVERSGVLITERKKKEFETDSIVQDLSRLIKFKEGQQANVLALPEMNLTVAVSALTALIKYLDLLSNEENFGQFKLESRNYEKFVHVDMAAMNALNVLQNNSSSTLSNNHTVLGLLDYCRTSHGHRLLMEWIRQPLRDFNSIKERHDLVESFLNHSNIRQTIYDQHLRRIPDFQAIAKKLIMKKATMQDCYKLYRGVEKLPELLECLNLFEGNGVDKTVSAVFTSNLEEAIEDLKKYKEMVECTLDMTAVDRGEFLVKSDFDEDLKELRCKMDELEMKMKKQLAQVASNLDLQEHKTIKLENNPQFGYFFRVTLKDGKIVHTGKGYEILDTHKGGVRFRNEKMGKLNADHLELRKEYETQQKTIVDEVMEIAGGYCNTFQYLSWLLAKMDVIISFAMAAARAPIVYIRPIMTSSDEGVLHLKGARHPCLELQDNISYIPNDVYFKQGEATAYIITGPNMGGKSTYIRSIGVIALLAHIGCFVPCEYARIPVLDAILARVGANDSQIKAMSTFMVEMVETSSIIRSATNKSLVIIDELGRGTSTYEGCGLASAIIEHLATETKAFTLFATHFHELTLLSEEISTIKNIHVTAITSHDGLKHMYQVNEGPSDQSFGIHVAKMARFPQRVINEAEEKLKTLDEMAAADKKVDTKTIKEGKKIIEEFIENYEELKNQTSLSDEERTLKFEELKENVLKKSNDYVQMLLK